MRSTVFLLLALFVISIESQPRRRKIGLRELLRSKVVYAEFVARKARSGKGLLQKFSISSLLDISLFSNHLYLDSR